MSRRERRKRSAMERLYTFIKVQIVLLLIIVAGVAYYYVGGYAAKVASMQAEAKALVTHSTKDTFRQSETSIVYDCGGEVIQKLKGEKDVFYLEYDNIPMYVTQSLVSIEDKKFYKHNGVDYRAVLRAFISYVEKKGTITQGGSTITQQLARTIFLSNDKTWQRKIEEMYVAIELENKYTKEEILEFYLNNVYFANGYYGIQAAAKGYFSKDVDELDLSEICFLIAIPNSPNNYDPLEHYPNTIKRRNTILKSMYDDGMISETTYNHAKDEIINLETQTATKKDYVETYAYYCATRVLMELDGFEFKNEFKNESEEKEYNRLYNEEYNACNKDLFSGGYRIYTSLDLDMQSLLQEAVDACLEDFTDVNDEGVYELQSAAVCIDNSTGQVRAIVGGRSQELKGYTLNRGFQSYRQPGSAIKPLIVYTPAIEEGYTPDTLVSDEKIEEGPENSSGKYSGNITIRQAVMYSKNTVAWNLFAELTPEVGLSYLKKMGFAKIDKNDGQASALGGMTYGVSPLEMAKGYATIENDGFARNPGCITKICNSQGTVLYENKFEETAIYKENAARTMTNMLQSVITDGTAKGIKLGDMPCAGKTGTTNDNRDGWFVGYTSYFTTSVWVGYDIPKKLPGLQGSSYPATIWQIFMNEIHEDLLPAEFKQPVSLIMDEDGDLELDEEEENIDDNLDEYVPVTHTITFDGTEIPEGAIPDGATNITVTTTTVVEEIPGGQ